MLDAYQIVPRVGAVGVDAFATIDMVVAADRVLRVQTGVGPKASLALLSLGPPERLVQAIQNKDAAFLSSAPGIGAKAAQKIILELQGKLGMLAAAEGIYRPTESDLLAALESLGYKPRDLHPYLQDIPSEHTSLDAQLKWMLQRLSR
jgi:Holliday junction DNA helicase RuvA